ncbi:MAG: TolC family protein [Candidatus Rokuibacteriota bacterium]
MRRPLIATVLALSLAPAARAQEVTEEEFLSTLDESHVAVRSLTGDVARAEGERVRARTLANPRLDFWREEPEDNPQVTNWTLAWTPPLDGRYGLRKKAAEAGLAAAREHFEADRAALRRDFRKAFAEWSLAFERRATLRQQLDLVAGLAEHERQRARVGEGSGLTARRFSLAEGDVRAEFGSADAEYARAEAAARALRQDLNAETRPAPVALPEPPASLDSDGAPQLSALKQEKEQAGYEARRVGRFLGFPTLQLGWQTIEDRGVSESGPIVAAGWTVPLFDRDQGARLEAERRRDVAAARLTFAQARLAGEVEGGLKAYRVLFASARDARDTAGETEKVIDAATAAFRAGEAGLTDLLDVLRSAFVARLRAIDSRAQALEAHRNLEAVLGQPLKAGGDR